MKQHLKPLAILTTLLFAPLSSKASLEMLMGGGGEPDPNAMHFPTFFNKVKSGTTLESSAAFISQDGKRTLTFTSKIVSSDSKKSAKGTGPFWQTKKEEEAVRSYVPSLDETPRANDVFGHFSGQIIEKVLGDSILPKRTERIDSSFVSEALKLPDPSKFFETVKIDKETGETTSSDLSPSSPSQENTKSLKRKASVLDKEGGKATTASSSDNDSRKAPPVKRKRFTPEFALDTLHASAVRSTCAQISLGSFLSEEDLEFTQTYLAGSGYLQLTLESSLTPELTLSNNFLIDNARRIPSLEGAVIDELQEWLEKHCNVLYKKYVLDKGGETLYG